MNKGIIAIIVIIIVFVVAAGAWITMQPAQPSSTDKKIKPQTHENSTNTTISAEKAKELASKYTGMGVTLGTPSLTTYNGVEVWKVPVYTSGQNLTVDSIYINAKTGNRVQ